MTPTPALGGRAWPSVILNDPDHEPAFALWCNSTLGLLMHWWMSNKTQSGRGSVTVTTIPEIPTLNLDALTPTQHAAARDAFETLSERRFLPFDQLDQDPARAELDRALLVDVLGLNESVAAAADRSISFAANWLPNRKSTVARERASYSPRTAKSTNRAPPPTPPAARCNRPPRRNRSPRPANPHPQTRSRAR